MKKPLIWHFALRQGCLQIETAVCSFQDCARWDRGARFKAHNLRGEKYHRPGVMPSKIGRHRRPPNLSPQRPQASASTLLRIIAADLRKFRRYWNYTIPHKATADTYFNLYRMIFPPRWELKRISLTYCGWAFLFCLMAFVNDAMRLSGLGTNQNFANYRHRRNARSEANEAIFRWVKT